MSVTFLTLPGATIETDLARLRESLPPGRRALIVGEDEARERLQEQLDDQRTATADIIAEAERLDVTAWLAARRAAVEAEYADELAAIVGYGEPSLEDLLPQWGTSMLHRASAGDGRLEQVVVATVEVAESWHLPAVMGWGGWNQCPSPAELTALAKRWQRRHGAEITGMTHAVLEWSLTRPPLNPGAAMALAWEQYLVCRDIVEQGTETITSLGSGLLRSPYWYFWWD